MKTSDLADLSPEDCAALYNALRLATATLWLTYATVETAPDGGRYRMMDMDSEPGRAWTALHDLQMSASRARLLNDWRHDARHAAPVE